MRPLRRRLEPRQDRRPRAAFAQEREGPARRGRGEDPLEDASHGRSLRQARRDLRQRLARGLDELGQGLEAVLGDQLGGDPIAARREAEGIRAAGEQAEAPCGEAGALAAGVADARLRRAEGDGEGRKSEGPQDLLDGLLPGRDQIDRARGGRLGQTAARIRRDDRAGQDFEEARRLGEADERPTGRPLAQRTEPAVEQALALDPGGDARRFEPLAEHRHRLRSAAEAFARLDVGRGDRHGRASVLALRRTGWDVARRLVLAWSMLMAPHAVDFALPLGLPSTALPELRM